MEETPEVHPKLVTLRGIDDMRREIASVGDSIICDDVGRGISSVV